MGQYYVSLTYVMAAKVKTSEALDRRHFFCDEQHFCLFDRETNLMSLALLFHYLLLNMSRMLIHPSSGACDLFDVLFHWLYCSGSLCVGVTLCFGWGGVVSVCRMKQCFSLHTDTTPPQPNHNVTPTRIEPEQYNP